MNNDENELTGIICINKPQGFTSFDVVAIVRKCFGIRKVGHGGTLDPMATGVLPVFVGRKATRLIDRLPDKNKAYEATFALGITTDTQDITGTVLTRSSVDVHENQVADAAKTFLGEITQIPPMYSAVKKDGKPLYKYARQGIEVEREPRKTTVYHIKAKRLTAVNYKLSVICSSGTYIRALIQDIGGVLGCGAAMTSLIRTKSHGFTLANCLELEKFREDIKTSDNPKSFLMPLPVIQETLYE